MLQTSSNIVTDERLIKTLGLCQQISPKLGGTPDTVGNTGCKENSFKVVKKLMMKGMTEGQSPSELLPYMMMSMMLDQKEKSKHRRRGRRDRDSPGGSSSESSASDDSDHKSGMRAVTSLHKLQKKITRHPKSIVKDFERQVVEELGVVEGQCWTLMDYVKRQQWGKFRGIYRCACMDVRAYELLRGGQTEAAQAQLVQNLKAKIQSVIQGGSWETAWLLTGIADPLSRREFGGSKEEMSVVSEYVNQMAKLKKRVKEASQQDKEQEKEAPTRRTRGPTGPSEAFA